MSDVVLELPTPLRAELKEPLGAIHTDTESLLSAAATPVVTVGDMVTYHVLEANRTPAVAFVDEKTERRAVDEEVRESITGFDERVTVTNPPATITGELIEALVAGVAATGTTLVRVDGEEDLAALPAVLAVPDGASVVYGQPGEGMVLVTADRPTRERVRSLIERMDGDVDAALEMLA